MEYKGRILKVFPVASGTKKDGSQWRRQDIIFEYFENDNARFSDRVLLGILNERIEQYNVQEGEEVKIDFWHSVHEFDGRYFNELKLNRFDRIQPAAHTTEVQQATAEKSGDNDELPF